ncbi:Hypothetical predicted protein [Podarcis lilfordi]|uniref:Uncharacterized protein n=1 Tax=Podarcis lilfordi TaxID=74358 RepID=A0AA35KFM6_9SAUR|nr:Hypothetical predicted protein [Podarcis lilfordi]
MVANLLRMIYTTDCNLCTSATRHPVNLEGAGLQGCSFPLSQNEQWGNFLAQMVVRRGQTVPDTEMVFPTLTCIFCNMEDIVGQGRLLMVGYRIVNRFQNVSNPLL